MNVCRLSYPVLVLLIFNHAYIAILSMLLVNFATVVDVTFSANLATYSIQKLNRPSGG